MSEEDSTQEELVDEIPSVALSEEPANKKLYDEILQKRVIEDSEDESLKRTLKAKIMNLQDADPKMDVTKKSPLEEQLQDMTVMELKDILERAQRRKGVYNPYPLATSAIQTFSLLAETYGVRINPILAADPEFLTLVESQMPVSIQAYADRIRTLQIFFTSFFVPLEATPQNVGSGRSNEENQSTQPSSSNGEIPNGKDNSSS